MSDVYSLGVVLLELLTVSCEEEYSKFETLNFDEYLDKLRLDEPVLTSLLDNILDPNPDLRLFDIQGFIKAGSEKIKVGSFKYFKKQDKIKITKLFARIYSDLQRNIKLEFDIKHIEAFKGKGVF